MNTPTISLPGRVLRAFGDEITVLLSGEQTGGQLALGIAVTPPGGGPPPHYHNNEDEWFVVQEGRISFFSDGKWTEVPVGAAIFIPRTVVHTFKNVGDKPCRMLVGVSPAGFEKFLRVVPTNSPNPAAQTCRASPRLPENTASTSSSRNRSIVRPEPKGGGVVRGVPVHVSRAKVR